MAKCVNPQCENFKHELEAGIELCPACGSKTEVTIVNHNNTLAIAAVIIGLVGFVLFWQTDIGTYLGPILAVAGVVLGFLSKHKAGIIISLIVVLGIGFIFANSHFGWFVL